MTNDFLDELDKELETISTPAIKKEEVKKVEEVKKTQDKKEQKKSRNNNQWPFVSFKDASLSKFPETKFYLPTLREWYTRFIPIGWNNETWAKNMWMVQYWEDIILIDCWVQFADEDMLWANYAIPDVWFLTKYKDKIKWMIITHAHLDHIWALKHVLPALWMPTLYWTKLTLGILKKQLTENKLIDKSTFVEIDAWSKEIHKIGQFSVEFFKVNHSIPDCAWFCLESPKWFRMVHTWDFKIDYTPAIDSPADLARIWWIWDRWVTLFLSDSTWSTRKGHSMSEAKVWEALEKLIANHKRGRLFIATFSSWLSRVQQLVDICQKYDKVMFLSWRSMIENVAIARELGYLHYKQWTIKKLTPKSTQWIPPHRQVIITTWSQWEDMAWLSRMANWTHPAVEIVKWDTVLFSSSVVPWNEKSVVNIINKLIKFGANVITKDDWDYHTWGHALQEEQEIMLKLVKSKFFMPVYWDLYFRTVHKRTAMRIGMKDSSILLSENGQIFDFAPNNTVFRSKIKVPLQEVVVDGHWIWVAWTHVMDARERMMNSWVLVLLFRVDKKTRAIIGHIKLETRWFVYVDEVRQVHRMIIKKSKSVYENTIKDVPEIEDKDLIKIIKTDLESFLIQRIDRNPMIIPMITEI